MQGPLRDASGGVETTAPTPQATPDDPSALVLQSALAQGLNGLRENEPAAREGDAKGVHYLRTTTRRLRTILGLFGDLTEPAWADELTAELKWLADRLGQVRDLDVLKDRLRAASGEDQLAEALEPLFSALDARHAGASEALQEGLRSKRYEGLITRLSGSLAALPLTEAASEPCRSALPALVHGLWKRLRRSGRALKPGDPDSAFHEVRKQAKRARYGAEAIVSALDPEPADAARRFARLARKVQDVLGTHQDAVVAASEIRKVALAHPELGPFNFAAGRLLEREQRVAAETRVAFFGGWDRLDRKKVVRWLKP